MRIVELRAENIKRLKVVRIRPDGSVVQITGPNDSGKSSVLDSIMFALGGQKGIEPMPVRDGAEKGLVRLDLGEMIVTRRFTAAGGTSLTIEAAANGEGTGAEFKSPQSMLDKLLGAMTFDPLAFSRMDPKAQLEQLRKLVTLDLDIDQIDFENRRDFDARTIVNRTAKDLAARVESIVIDPGTPEQPVVLEALMQDMEAAVEHNRQVDQEAARRAARTQKMHEQAEDIERMERQVEALRQTIDQLSSARKMNADLAAAEGALPEKRDLAVYRQQMADAQVTNAAVGLRAEKARLGAELAAVEGEAAKLSQQMADRTAQRQAAITAAKMPIPGLGFGEGFVTHNGVPFQQASSAQQLKASIAIAMAANPKLRVLRIKDGSLLDPASLALVAEMAEQHDYQIWMERVDVSGAVGIVMEDGEVVGASQGDQ